MTLTGQCPTTPMILKSSIQCKFNKIPVKQHIKYRSLLALPDCLLHVLNACVSYTYFYQHIKIYLSVWKMHLYHVLPWCPHVWLYNISNLGWNPVFHILNIKLVLNKCISFSGMALSSSHEYFSATFYTCLYTGFNHSNK